MCVCTCSSACVCWCEGLKDTWPGNRFSRLEAVTGSKPCSPQTSLSSFPITKNNSSFTLLLSVFHFLATRLVPHTQARTLFSSPLSSSLWDVEELSLRRVSHQLQLYFPCCYTPLPCHGPLRITWGHQFGVISIIWTMKLWHLRVFVKILSQDMLLVCWDASHTVVHEVKYWHEV